MDDFERQERVARARQLVEDAVVFQQEAFKNAGAAAINEGIKDALKEAGLNESDWEKIYYSNPETTIAKQRSQVKKFASKLINKATKGQRAPDDRPSDSAASLRQGGQRPRGSDSKDISAIAEQQRGGKMNSDQALDRMLQMSLGDYFKRTMGE
jgi:hypothetical protein